MYVCTCVLSLGVAFMHNSVYVCQECSDYEALHGWKQATCTCIHELHDPVSCV